MSTGTSLGAAVMRPETPNQFVELIRRAGIVPDAVLNECIQSADYTSACGHGLSGVMSYFITSGVLTNFQTRLLI